MPPDAPAPEVVRSDPAERPPSVGVVIAAYQAERFIAEALTSVLGQTFVDWCCVVVDDGSTDDTAAVATRVAAGDRRVAVVRQDNAGVSHARNAGFRSLPATARYVCFLDSDDVLAPDALEVLLGALAERPDAAGCSGWAESMDAGGTPVAPGRHRDVQRLRPAYRGLRTRLLSAEEDTTFESLAIRGTIWPPATALTDCSVVRRIGGFDPGLSSQEDWDFFLQAARTGPFVFVDRQVAWYRRHESNATKDHLEYLRCVEIVRRKTWRDRSNTAAQRRVILRAHLRAFAWMAKRQLHLMRREAGERRVGALLCGTCWTLYALVQLIRFRPGAPSPAVLRALAALETRFRGSRGGETFLDTG